MQLISNSVADTQKIAKVLVEKLLNGSPASLKLRKTIATVVAIEGELGAGKTVLVKALAKALGVKQAITSPTFVLIKSYKLKTINYKLLYHIDAYRLKDEKDLIALGIKEILADPSNLVLIEWADRVKKLIPKNVIKIYIDHIGESERKLSIL